MDHDEKMESFAFWGFCCNTSSSMSDVQVSSAGILVVDLTLIVEQNYAKLRWVSHKSKIDVHAGLAPPSITFERVA